MGEKKDRGRIKDWAFLPIRHGRELVVVGTSLDHDWVRGDVSTSRVVRYDAETGIIETLNSRYRLVDEGEPSPRKGWPNPGDTYRFLGKNGHEHELKEALELLTVDRAYTIAECEVGSWSHRIRLVIRPDTWFNGVMFERVD